MGDIEIIPPELCKYHVHRRELTFQILSNQTKKLTVITAPSGYGKTSLARELCNLSGFAYCWYNIQDEDTTFLDFVKTLAQSLASILSDFPQEIWSINTEDVWEYSGLTLRALENSPSPLMIVIDNFEYVQNDKDIKLFVKLLVQLLPDHCHVILCSSAPLNIDIAASIINEQVVHISKADLLFSQEEAHILAHKMHVPKEICTFAIKNSSMWVAELLILFQQPSPIDSFNAISLNQHIYEDIKNKLTTPEYEAMVATLPLQQFDRDDVTVLLECDYQLFDDIASKHYILKRLHDDKNIIYKYDVFFAQAIMNYLKDTYPSVWRISHKRIADSLQGSNDLRAFNIYVAINDEEALNQLIEKCFQKWIEKDLLLLKRHIVSTAFSLQPHNPYVQLLQAESLIKTKPKEATTMFRRLIYTAPTPYLSSLAKLGLIRSLYHSGSYHTMVDIQEHNLTIIESITEDYERGIAKNMLARAYMSLEHYPEAEKLFLEVQDIASNINNEYLEVVALSGLAAYFIYRGKCVEAIKLNLKAQQYWEKRKNWFEVVRTKNDLATAYYSVGELEEALIFMAEAMKLIEEYDLQDKFPLAFCTLGDVSLGLDNLSQAKIAFAQLSTDETINFNSLYALTGQARIALKEKNYSLALDLATKGHEWSTKKCIAYTEGLNLLILAATHHMTEQKEKALELAKQARIVYHDNGFKQDEARALQLIWKINPQEDKKVLQDIDEIAQHVGFSPHLYDLPPIESSSEAPKLVVQSFGKLEFYVDDTLISPKELQGRKTAHLLFYLAVADAPYSREQIFDDLWEDTDKTTGSAKASDRVHTSLSRVRRVLGGKHAVIYERGMYQLAKEYAVQESGQEILKLSTESKCEDILQALVNVPIHHYLTEMNTNWAVNLRNQVEVHILELVTHLCRHSQMDNAQLASIVERALDIAPEELTLHMWLIQHFIAQGLYHQAKAQTRTYTQAAQDVNMPIDSAIIHAIDNLA